MNSINQTAKGALIAGGLYYLLHAHIANRTHLISTSLRELSAQFRTLDSEEKWIQTTWPARIPTRSLTERIQLNWNQSIVSLSKKAHEFNLSSSADRMINFLKSRFESDASQS